MTPEERNNYIKAAIVAGVGAAGIGALIRDIKSKKSRKKNMDFSSSSNAIVIPINKRVFLDGLPTKAEHKQMFGDSSEEQKPLLEVTNPTDLASAKREILRGRKFDFFGKKASTEEEKKDVPASGEKEVKEVSEEKIDGRIVLRGQDGRFVSQTDPVAVQEVEKSAGFNPFQPFVDPSGFLKDLKSGMLGKPIAFTAGAIGSIVLASKISDAINERRKERAKKKLDRSRENYVKILEDDSEGSEKSASGGDSHDGSFGDLSGKVIGASFFVPMALTALVTNKIIENRKAEKKRKKEMSNSYPEDPIILYQTYDGKNTKIAADTALMAIMVKRAMMEDAERAEAELIKSAQFVPGGGIGVDVTKKRDSPYSDDEINKAVDYAAKILGDKGNSGALLDTIKRYGAGESVDLGETFSGMVPTVDKIPLIGNVFGDMPRNFDEISKTPEFKQRLAQNGGLTDTIIDRFDTDPEWKKYKQERIENGLADKIEGWGFQKGGILHNIIAWFMKLFGAGNSDFNDSVRQSFSRLAGPEQGQGQEGPAEQQNVQPEQNTQNPSVAATETTPQTASPAAEAPKNPANTPAAAPAAQAVPAAQATPAAPAAPAATAAPATQAANKTFADFVNGADAGFDPLGVRKHPGVVPQIPAPVQKPVGPRRSVPGERVPDENDFSWRYFQNLPKNMDNKQLNDIVDLGKRQFEYNSGARGVTPTTPVNRGSGEIPVNTGLISRELGMGEAYDENGQPVYDQYKEQPKPGNKPVASPIITR